MNNPFQYFNSSPDVIRLAVMMDIRYPLSLRQVEDILFERGIDICHETVRYWWNRFGPLFAGEIRKRRVHARNGSNWRWYLAEVFVRINGETHYLWRAVDHEGEVLEVFATNRRDRRAAPAPEGLQRGHGSGRGYGARRRPCPPPPGSIHRGAGGGAHPARCGDHEKGRCFKGLDRVFCHSTVRSRGPGSAIGEVAGPPSSRSMSLSQVKKWTA